jgi:hypothetical protein
MRRAASLLMIGLFAGCANELAERQAYLSQFIGQPESAVVQAMGVPSRSFETGGITYLAYSEHRIDFIPGTPTYAPFFVGGYGGGFPPQIVQLDCETTFQVEDGKIRSYVLRGNACG